MDGLTATLALLKREEFFPLWSCVDRMEQLGEMSADDAIRWNHGIFGLMELWGLEPDDLATTSDSW